MPLTGVNRKCAHCIKDCKQFKQVTVVYCPFWHPKLRKNSKCKAEEMLKQPSTAILEPKGSQVRVNGQLYTK